VRVVTEAGSIVAAAPPAAVGAGNVEVSQRVADVCLLALAQFVPDRVGACGQGTMNNVLIGGAGFVHYETLGGGQGARPWADGMSGVHTAMTNTLDTPVEALERVHPLRIRTMTIRRGSGGSGRHRGGDGIERHYEFCAPATVSLISERRVSGPPGLAGGADGRPGAQRLQRAGQRYGEAIADKATFEVGVGDVLEIVTPGGGGWGAAR
jgi:N-methylhydantoinase B/oxoprolinase/acetone carboxylase alpha subunit